MNRGGEKGSRFLQASSAGNRDVSLAEPPAHLSAAVRQWWARVVEDYELEEHREAWDEAQQARAELQAHGSLTVEAAHGLKAHPAVAVRDKAQRRFAMLLKELALPDPEDVPK